MNVSKLATEVWGYSDWKGAPLERLEAFAALVRAEREWVELTDDEIGKAIGTLLPIRRELNDARAVIAAFKEKNK